MQAIFAFFFVFVIFLFSLKEKKQENKRKHKKNCVCTQHSTGKTTLVAFVEICLKKNRFLYLNC
jgi:uncharacterized protein YpmS